MKSYGVAIQINPLELNFYTVLFNFKDFATLEIWNFCVRVINNIENYLCVVESSDCVGALPAEPSRRMQRAHYNVSIHVTR